MGGYGQAMRRYASFQGRASRAEFWQFMVVLVGLGFVALVIDAAVTQEANAGPRKELEPCPAALRRAGGWGVDR